MYFSFRKKLWELINKEANKIGKEYRNKIKKENPKMSKTKLNEKCDNYKKEFRKEMGKFVELVMVFRYQ